MPKHTKTPTGSSSRPSLASRLGTMPRPARSSKPRPPRVEKPAAPAVHKPAPSVPPRTLAGHLVTIPPASVARSLGTLRGLRRS